MNRIAKPGDVARWFRNPAVDAATMDALRATGFKTSHLVDMSGEDPFVAGISADELGRRVVKRFAGGDARLLELGFGPEIDPFHGFNVQPFFTARGIADPTPAETAYAAYVYGRAMIAHLPGLGGGGSAGAPGSSPDNPWPRSTAPRGSQARFEFIFIKDAPKPWQQWKGGEKGTFSPEWIKAAGGVVPPAPPPVDPPPVDHPAEPPNGSAIYRLALEGGGELKVEVGANGLLRQVGVPGGGE